MDTSEHIAKQFHAAYERLAPNYGYKTRTESAVPWDQVPRHNRSLMIAVVEELLDRGIIARPRRQSIRRDLEVQAEAGIKHG